MTPRAARELYDQLGLAQRKLEDILNHPGEVDSADNVAYVSRKLDAIRKDLPPAADPPPESDPDGSAPFAAAGRELVRQLGLAQDHLDSILARPLDPDYNDQVRAACKRLADIHQKLQPIANPPPPR